MSSHIAQDGNVEAETSLGFFTHVEFNQSIAHLKEVKLTFRQLEWSLDLDQGSKLRQIVRDEKVVPLAKSLDVGVVPGHSDVIDSHICSDVATNDYLFILTKIDYMDQLFVVLGVQGLNHQEIFVVWQRVIK